MLKRFLIFAVFVSTSICFVTLRADDVKRTAEIDVVNFNI